MAGLYIHIPFCIKKCDYCDFTSFPHAGVPDVYVNALVQEIVLTTKQDAFPQVFDTVFFGGGTPSLLSPEQVVMILHSLYESFSIIEGTEVSLECNPGTVDEEKLYQFRQAGVNRLSVGLQSSSDTLLQHIGRIHDCKQFISTIQMARDAGFTNISADIMHGLPEQRMGDFTETLALVCELDLPHISSYALNLSENTALVTRIKNGELTLPEEDDTADMQDAGIAYLDRHGYERYEISNFAKPGFACRHNLHYWNNDSYIGFGLAAHSAVRLREWTRLANVEKLKNYYRSLRYGRLPVAEKIRIFPAEEMFECVMLGLRLVSGINRNAFYSRFGISLSEAYASALIALRQRGWLYESETHIALTKQGLDMQNTALQYFM